MLTNATNTAQQSHEPGSPAHATTYGTLSPSTEGDNRKPTILYRRHASKMRAVLSAVGARLVSHADVMYHVAAGVNATLFSFRWDVCVFRAM